MTLPLSLRTIATAFAALSLPGATTLAAVIGTDTASHVAYDDGWQTGDDGGTALSFGTWLLTNQGANSGHFIGSSTALAAGNTGADINSSGESFGLFGHSGQTANAFRDFGGLTLSVGQTFSLDLAVNFRNGDKGFVLRDSADADLFIFKVTGDDYLVTTAATGLGSIGSTYSADTEFSLSFTQTSLSGGTWAISRSGGVTDSDTGTYTGVAENIVVYNSQTVGAGLPENNLFVNNFKIVPEPGCSSLLVGSLLVFAARRRRPAGSPA